MGDFRWQGLRCHPGSHPRVFELIRATLRSSPLFTVLHRHLFSMIFPFSCQGCWFPCLWLPWWVCLSAFETWSGWISNLARKCVWSGVLSSVFPQLVTNSCFDGINNLINCQGICPLKSTFMYIISCDIVHSPFGSSFSAVFPFYSWEHWGPERLPKVTQWQNLDFNTSSPPSLGPDPYVFAFFPPLALDLDRGP